MRTGILALGAEFLPLPLNDRCVLVVTIETGIVGIATKSVGASKEVGSHVVNIRSLDLK